MDSGKACKVALMGRRNWIAILIQFLSLVFLQQTTCFNNETDLHSLLAIKSAINHDPFGALHSWNETTHLCSWNGIQCSFNGVVVGISLISQGLVGTLSPHLGNLSFLRTLHLQNNSFRGHIPQQIGLLRRLESLILENNSFVSSIPTNLSQCQNLIHLSLSDNDLSGAIPTDLGSLSKLRVLVLANNNLSGPIPPSLGNLTSLIEISCLTCGLTGEVPPSFAQLRSLVFLQLSNNYLTAAIPSSLFNLSTIQFFYVAGNHLSGTLPSNLGFTFSNLRGLYLWENDFTGPIPISISNASFLGQLDLSLNSFTGRMPRVYSLTLLRSYGFESNLLVDDMSFISSLINSTELETIGVGDNMLSGSLPDSLANLSTSLSNLDMGQNLISGRIPSGVGKLIGLTSVDLSYNVLDGPIPTSIGILIALNMFNVRANSMTNALPSSFGNLTSLTTLYLADNSFRGILPSSLGNCTSLSDFDLSKNNFSGPIPLQLMSLSSLSVMFNLSYNNVDGSIPDEVGLLTNLAVLDLSNNRLSGLIPDILGQCASVLQLYLENNLLQGQIPAGMSSLLGLTNLDLSHNSLSGVIPDFLGKLKLERLDLSFNRLEGEVPIMGVFKNISLVSLQGNQLCGGVSELRLPPCSVKESHKRIWIPILVFGGVCLILLTFITYKRRIPRKDIAPLTPLPTFEIMRLSYADLVTATEGFHTANTLGVGRFGSVYKGTLEDGRTEVAVKVINLSVRGASESFLAECNSLRNVRHRNILKILSVCESVDFQENDFKALVYEYKANGSLEKWLHHTREEENAETNNLTMIQRLNIAIGIAQALEYLHIGTHLAIVHGDLKPSNILLDHEMIASIGDFGMATIISDMVSIHESTSVGIRGTIGYVAPEYAMDSFISTQGDIYSYGIVVLEMFTNRRPTAEEFEVDVNLHSFVCNALSNQIEEVVDPSLLGDCMKPMAKDCMSSILRIGLACSTSLQRDRMLITNVVKALCKIRDSYLSS